MPTYIALRLFAEQLPKSDDSDFLIKYLIHKLPLRKSSRYCHYRRFKRIISDKRIEYRDMYAASPSTALAEAYALRLLSKIEKFRSKPYVFSYRWATEHEGNSYRYFYSGYSERNNLVTKLLRDNNDYYLSVYDIEKFYPSINRQFVATTLCKYLEKQNEGDTNFIRQVSYQLMAATPHGLPIGPALSHVLANTALENVDTEMYGRLKSRYLRYVDDIYLVSEKKDLLDNQIQLEQLLKQHNLRLNRDKQEDVSSLEWLKNVPESNEIWLLHQKFNSLMHKIILFLWSKPETIKEMKRCFQQDGIAMPLDRFASYAMYGRFHRFMKTLIKNTRIYFSQTLKNVDVNSLLTETKCLYDEFYNYISRQDFSTMSDCRTVNKFRIQRHLSLLNRILYLTPYPSYSKLRDIIPDAPEFYEFRLLVDSLIKQTVNELIELPGVGISLFAMVSRELQFKKMFISSEKIGSNSILDSICTLVAHGVIETPMPWFEQLSDNDKELIKFCEFSNSTSRVLTDLSYEDEVRTLQINTDPAKRDAYISTRFSDLEGLNLDTLLLGTYDY